MNMVNYMLLNHATPKTFRVKLSYLFAMSSIGFPTKTLILLHMNDGRAELLIPNSSKYEVDWLRFL